MSAVNSPAAQDEGLQQDGGAMVLPDSLVAVAEDQGYVSTDDLLDAFPEGVNTVSDWETILDALSGLGIRVMEAPESPLEGDEAASGNGRGLRTSVHNPIDFYLREAGAWPLLSAEQEQSLARRIEQGVAAQQSLNDGHDAAREAELGRLVADGERARDNLIRANLRLVVNIAKRYQRLGLPLIDLIQEGNLGLIQAVDRFDWRRGTRFSTYATWWIRHAILRALDNKSRSIRLPTNVLQDVRSLRRSRESLREELGRQPTPDEIAEHTDVGFNEQQWLQRVARSVVSLDRPLQTASDGEQTLGSVLPDTSSPRPLARATRELMGRDVRQVLHELSEREQRVLAMRYGLEDGKAHTLEQVASEMGVTRERVRQIERRALRKLRHPLRARRLRDYVGR